MKTSLSTIRLFKRGVQPVLIVTEREDDGTGRFVITYYLVWPERQQGGAEVEKLVQVSMPLSRNSDADARRTAANLMRSAAQELAIHRAAKLADSFPNAAEDVQMAAMDMNKLRALRSVGLFPGMGNYNVIDSHTATLLVNLDLPLGFNVE